MPWDGEARAPRTRRGLTAAAVIAAHLAVVAALGRHAHLLSAAGDKTMHIIRLPPQDQPANSPGPPPTIPPPPRLTALAVPVPVPVPDIRIARPDPIRSAPAHTTPVATPVIVAQPVPPGAVPAASPQPPLQWQAQLMRRLLQVRRYPPVARAQRQQGVVRIRFTLDRGGHVISAELLTGSGSATLDAEAIAMVYRAQPLPPPPGSGVTITIPIAFTLAQAAAE